MHVVAAWHNGTEWGSPVSGLAGLTRAHCAGNRWIPPGRSMSCLFVPVGSPCCRDGAREELLHHHSTMGSPLTWRVGPGQQHDKHNNVLSHYICAGLSSPPTPVLSHSVNLDDSCSTAQLVCVRAMLAALFLWCAASCVVLSYHVQCASLLLSCATCVCRLQWMFMLLRLLLVPNERNTNHTHNTRGHTMTIRLEFCKFEGTDTTTCVGVDYRLFIYIICPCEMC